MVTAQPYGPHGARNVCNGWADRCSEPRILAACLPLTRHVGRAANFATNENFVANRVLKIQFFATSASGTSPVSRSLSSCTTFSKQRRTWSVVVTENRVSQRDPRPTRFQPRRSRTTLRHSSAECEKPVTRYLQSVCRACSSAESAEAIADLTAFSLLPPPVPSNCPT